MLKIIFLFIFIFIGGGAQAQSKSGAESQNLQAPVLLPNQAIKLAEDYLTQVKHIERNKFRLHSVSYRYFSTTPPPPGVTASGWSIDFDCIPDQLDCSYSVELSNAKKPNIVAFQH